MSDPTRRRVLRASGVGLAVLGTIGIIVPLWPTTCFYLGAVWCFSRSAPSWTRVLYRMPGIGLALQTLVETGTVPASILIRTAGVLWLGLGFSWLVLRPGPVVTSILALVGVSVSIHLIQVGRREPRTSAANCPHRAGVAPALEVHG